MTAQPSTIHPDAPFLEALRTMYRGRFRHLPVVEFDRPLGMVSVRDTLADDLSDLHGCARAAGGLPYYASRASAGAFTRPR